LNPDGLRLAMSRHDFAEVTISGFEVVAEGWVGSDSDSSWRWKRVHAYRELTIVSNAKDDASFVVLLLLLLLLYTLVCLRDGLWIELGTCSAWQVSKDRRLIVMMRDLIARLARLIQDIQ